MKPVINLDDLVLEETEAGPHHHKYGIISNRIGAKALGYNLTIVPPDNKANFFHNHHNNEEMFFVVEGSGILRFGDKEYEIRKYDVIACPAGKREVAHQIINTGNSDLKYLALSTKERVDACEFPDSDKISVMVGDYGAMDLFSVFKADTKVHYAEGER